ncbi:MAG: hypothetical protein V7676_16470 [Parasphingorhabdus sp.]
MRIEQKRLHWHAPYEGAVDIGRPASGTAKRSSTFKAAALDREVLEL